MSYWWWQESFTRQHLSMPSEHSLSTHCTLGAVPPSRHVLSPFNPLGEGEINLFPFYLGKRKFSLRKVEETTAVKSTGKELRTCNLQREDVQPQRLLHDRAIDCTTESTLPHGGQSITSTTTSLSANNHLNSLPIYVYFFIFSNTKQSKG